MVYLDGIIFLLTNKPNSRWSLCIPHLNPDLSTDEIKKIIPSYTKGNTQGILTLPDNSRIVIYGKDQKEVANFFNIIISKKVIAPKYLENELPLKIGTINANYKEVAVIPESAKFFATGQKNLSPDWFISFNT